jgi:hypothetical protein
MPGQTRAVIVMAYVALAFLAFTLGYVLHHDVAGS